MGKTRAGNKPSGDKKACAMKALTRSESIDTVKHELTAFAEGHMGKSRAGNKVPGGKQLSAGGSCHC